MWDNLVILGGAIKRNPRKALALSLFTFAVAWFAVLRVPSALGCAWDSVVVQSNASENWRYNWIADTCQYNNGSRWIDLNRYVDTGQDGLEE